jgi:hypothetical protein
MRSGQENEGKGGERRVRKIMREGVKRDGGGGRLGVSTMCSFLRNREGTPPKEECVVWNKNCAVAEKLQNFQIMFSY